MATSNMIVPEALTQNNYEEWSIYMKNYLLAKNVWDVVDCPSVHGPLTKKEEARWARKNAIALHVLQISCAPEIFSEIKGINSARDAWIKLAEIKEQLEQNPKFLRSGLHMEGSELIEVSTWKERFIPGTESIERTTFLAIISAVSKNDREAMRTVFQNQLVEILNSWGSIYLASLFFTVAYSDNVETVKQYLDPMSLEDLETRDWEGKTILAVAANLKTTKIAEAIVEKIPRLLVIPDNSGMIPVVKACYQRNKEMTRFLYLKTPIESSLAPPENAAQGALLLHFCIQSEMLDIALDLLEKYPRLAFMKNSLGITPVVTLSGQPSLFSSGCELYFWQRWIYAYIEVEPIALSKSVSDSVSDETNASIKNQVSCQSCGWTSILEDVFGISKIRERKLIHKSAAMILNSMTKELTALNYKEMVDSGIIPALFQTTRLGMDYFSESFIGSNQDLLLTYNILPSLYVHGIEFRQDKVFKYDEISDIYRYLIAFRDKNNNNVLHVAAKLAPSSKLDGISGPALQMQRELQWFKEVESIVPECNQLVNDNGETPRQLFSREHGKMVEDGQEWMKQAAQSYTVVGALIITMMFAAAFTIPGGNQDSGLPMFLHDKLFAAYILSDAVALSSSATSVLMFLGILTSRYAEDDFLKSLPTKLIIGIFTLLVSVTAMMVTFCTAVGIMLPGKWWMVMVIILFASIPVMAFMLLQSRLLIEILHSTYGPRILLFKKESSSVRKSISAAIYGAACWRNCCNFSSLKWCLSD